MAKATYAIGIRLTEVYEVAAKKLREKGIKNNDIYIAGIKALDGVTCDSALDNAND